MIPRRLSVAAFAAYVLVLAGNRSLRRVEGGSMRPTLAPGDLLVVVPARATRLRRGAVVVVPDPREPTRRTVKRVAGLAGDTVAAGGRTLVAGANQVVVLGDDPDGSTDSRVYGPVAAADVRAVAVAALTPFRWLWPGRTAAPGAPRGR